MTHTKHTQRGIYRCPDNADHDEHYRGITEKPGKCPICGAVKEFLPHKETMP